MRDPLQWFQRTITPTTFIWYVIIGTVVSFAWTSATIWTYHTLQWTYISTPGRSALFLIKAPEWWVYFVQVCGEETLFRFAPAVCGIWLWGFGWRTVGLMFGAAVIFGLWHDSPYTIFMQGMCGFIWGLLYLRCGGATGQSGTAMAACISAHTLVDVAMYGAPHFNWFLGG